MAIRKSMVILTGVAFLASALPVPAFSQTLQPEPVRLTPPKMDEAVVKIFDAFPNGGPQLTARISDAIVNDLGFAYKLVQYVRSSSKLNEAQKAAAEQGFAEALKRLGATMADLGGSLKDLPLPPEAAPRKWGWLLLLVAAGTGIGLCIGDVICDDGNNNNKNKVSPN